MKLPPGQKADVGNFEGISSLFFSNCTKQALNDTGKRVKKKQGGPRGPPRRNGPTPKDAPRR